MSDGGDFEEVLMTAKEIESFIHGSGDVKNKNGESLVLKRSTDSERQVPEEESEKIAIGDGVEKQVLKAGAGECPKKHATCFVHYRGWIKETGDKFFDTWEEGQPAEIVIGHERQGLKGLVLAVATMQPGERSLVHVGWRHGYGKEGSFSFPTVPPESDLIYEVELKGFEPAKAGGAFFHTVFGYDFWFKATLASPLQELGDQVVQMRAPLRRARLFFLQRIAHAVLKEGRPRSEMTVEERIAAADRRRVDGNDLFKGGDVEEALKQYEMALTFMGDDFMFQLEGHYRESADAVRIPCLLNIAACMLKLKQYNEAIATCNMVLVDDRNNVKALFRRARARVALGQSEDAIIDFKRALKFSPGDKEISRELKLAVEHEKAVTDKQKKMYKEMFKPQPEEERGSWIWRIWRWLKLMLKKFWPLKRRIRVEGKKVL